MKISVITPIYKGKKYISTLLQTLEKCAKVAADIARIEWIISNDYPDEFIEENLSSDFIDIYVINTDVNRGIQGARVVGLGQATGEFVLFLDQDDSIDVNWIKSQIEHIDKYDGVVCNCQFDGHSFYNGWDRPDLDICITKDYNIREKNGFVPGQVLIRKSSIPSVWIDNWLKWNACDDQLLWLCMFGQGASFVSNRNTCYYHNKSGNNQSRNLPDRYLSNKEMINLLKEKAVLNDEEIELLELSRDSETIKYLQQNASQKRKIDIYEKLLKCYENNNSQWYDDTLMLKDGIGIYGVNLGIHIYRLLNRDGIKIQCFIDRNKELKDIPLPIFDRSNIPKGITTIINTLLMERDNVSDYLADKYPDVRVIGIEQLLK